VGLIIAGWLTDVRFFTAEQGYRYFGPILAIFILVGTLVLQMVTMDFDFEKLEKEYGGKRAAK
jgi:hypothetical protein